MRRSGASASALVGSVERARHGGSKHPPPSHAPAPWQLLGLRSPGLQTMAAPAGLVDTHQGHRPHRPALAQSVRAGRGWRHPAAPRRQNTNSRRWGLGLRAPRGVSKSSKLEISMGGWSLKEAVNQWIRSWASMPRCSSSVPPRSCWLWAAAARPCGTPRCQCSQSTAPARLAPAGTAPQARSLQGLPLPLVSA